MIDDLWRIENRLRDGADDSRNPACYPESGYGAIRRRRLDQLAKDFTVESGIGAAPIRMVVRSKATGLEPWLEPLGAKAQMMAFLWWHILVNENWRKLRRCELCHTWFAVLDRPQKQRFCSTTCHNRWYGRERRRDRKKALKRQARSKALHRARLRLVVRRTA